MKTGLSQILDSISKKYWLDRLVDDALELHKDRARTTHEFHCSSAGGCPRLIQFRMHNLYPEKVDLIKRRIFDNGDAVHERYVNYFKRTPNYVDNEVKIRINIDGVNLVGSADLVLKDYDGKLHIIEMKSINDKRFSNMMLKNSCVEENFLQWNLYSKGLGIEDGAILYENKDNQQLAIFPVKFNQKAFDDTFNIFKMIDDCNKKNIIVPFWDKCDPTYCSAKVACKEDIENAKSDKRNKRKS